MSLLIVLVTSTSRFINSQTVRIDGLLIIIIIIIINIDAIYLTKC